MTRRGHLTYLREMEPKRVLQVTRAAEMFWLVASIFATVGTVVLMYTEGIESNKFLPLIPVLSWLWYYVRRTFRKRLESAEDSQHPNH